MKAAIMIAILLVLAACEYSPGLTPECKQGIDNFDIEIEEGDIIAKIIDITETCQGGNMGGGCHLTLTLQGKQRNAQVSVLAIASSGGGVKAGGTYCENQDACAAHVERKLTEYQACECTTDDLDYACVCDDYTYTETFSVEDDETYRSVKEKQLNLELDESSIGKYVKARVTASDFTPVELVECEQ